MVADGNSFMGPYIVHHKIQGTFAKRQEGALNHNSLQGPSAHCSFSNQ